MAPNNPASNRSSPGGLPPLAEQAVVPASPSDKIKLSLLATALIDALGGPVEFHKRGTFPFTTSFLPNSNFQARFGVLAAGTWTDDTSLTLCLARSIARHGFDQAKQLDAYQKWNEEGELSATGFCFDIGGTTWTALDIYSQDKARNLSLPVILQHIRDALSSPRSGGNGSLMRVLPVGLVYWRDPEQAKEYARKSSETTHPASLAAEACELWTGIIGTIMKNATVVVPGSTSESAPEAAVIGTLRYTKLDLLKYISEYPYENEDLRKRLTIPVEAPPPPSSYISDADLSTQEAYYWQHHPILQLISKTDKARPYGDPTPDHPVGQSRYNESSDTSRRPDEFPFALPAEKDLPSSGYVLHTLVAALYCFFATDTFEAGGILAVNLGDDADTVGAVYAGLAGCWYASLDSGKSGRKGGLDNSGTGGGGVEGREAARPDLFWSEKVRKWKDGLVRRDLVEDVAEELAGYEKTQHEYSAIEANSNCCVAW